ncbi:MAG: DUF1576 domain-containing protein [Oscillospiraceae bacterium]
MPLEGQERRKKYRPYHFMFAIYAVFVVFAFILSTPMEIVQGLWRIITCRSVLISDYMAVGGMGAALINAVLVGVFSILVQVSVKTRPNGSTLMAMWFSTAFALFGKNLFNMWPLTFGVWLYAKVKKEPFKNFTLMALLSATVSLVISAICFHPDIPFYIAFPLGIGMGVLVGFIFPAVAAYTVRVHNGYSLYNAGFAGGLISTFVMSGFAAVDIPIENATDWYVGGDVPLAVLLYIVSAMLMLYGLFGNGRLEIPPYREIMKTSGRVVTDYLVNFGNAAYFNMGLLCAAATTLMLVLKADINGATMCGIFSIVACGAFGKHLRNVTPVVIGAIICTIVNKYDPVAPANTLAILFCTGLAPIAGQFGPIWGVITGFLHVNTVTHIGFLNSGLNLYNNGYATGFMCLLLVPIITAFHKEERRRLVRRKDRGNE